LGLGGGANVRKRGDGEPPTARSPRASRSTRRRGPRCKWSSTQPIPNPESWGSPDYAHPHRALTSALAGGCRQADRQNAGLGRSRSARNGLPDRLAVSAQIGTSHAMSRVVLSLTRRPQPVWRQGICLALARAGYRIAFTFRARRHTPHTTLGIVASIRSRCRERSAEDVTQPQGALRAVEAAQQRSGAA